MNLRTLLASTALVASLALPGLAAAHGMDRFDRGAGYGRQEYSRVEYGREAPRFERAREWGRDRAPVYQQHGRFERVRGWFGR